jgi:hypothetical protein
MLPGTTSEKIDNARLNAPNLKEGNEHFYIYPQELYTPLLISKHDLKFNNPDNMSEDTYKYERLRIYIYTQSTSCRLGKCVRQQVVSKDDSWIGLRILVCSAR